MTVVADSTSSDESEGLSYWFYKFFRRVYFQLYLSDVDITDLVSLFQKKYLLQIFYRIEEYVSFFSEILQNML